MPEKISRFLAPYVCDSAENSTGSLFHDPRLSAKFCQNWSSFGGDTSFKKSTNEQQIGNWRTHMRRSDAARALTGTWQHFSGWNDIIKVPILKGWRHIENPSSSVDTNYFKNIFRLLASYDLKRRSLFEERARTSTAQEEQGWTTTRCDMRSFPDPKKITITSAWSTWTDNIIIAVSTWSGLLWWSIQGLPIASYTQQGGSVSEWDIG